MSSVNKIILVGHLGADPDLRYTQEGRPVCSMSVATNHVYTDKAQQRQEKVSWHRVVVWGRMGEVCKEHLRKGRQIYVEGRLDSHSYTDKEGKRRYGTEVVGQNVIFLDRTLSTHDGTPAPEGLATSLSDCGGRAECGGNGGGDGLPF